jgi:hypothetical protein
MPTADDMNVKEFFKDIIVYKLNPEFMGKETCSIF